MKWRHIKDPSKFRARKVELDGYKFDSKREARRYQELKLMEKAGEIAILEVHPKFSIKIGDRKICDYVADFDYVEDRSKPKRVVEDVKGVKTAVYRLKKKLMKAVYGIDIVEI